MATPDGSQNALCNCISRINVVSDLNGDDRNASKANCVNKGKVEELKDIIPLLSYIVRVLKMCFVHLNKVS